MSKQVEHWVSECWLCEKRFLDTSGKSPCCNKYLENVSNYFNNNTTKEEYEIIKNKNYERNSN
jgi:hypothetical protein